MSRPKLFAAKTMDAMRACIEALEQRRLLSLTVPAFSSLPGAPHNLYLIFDGDPGFTGPLHLPVFDLDNNPNSFNDQEVADIKQIWSAVSDAYSPFNVNVTTVSPGANDIPGVTLGVYFGQHTTSFEDGVSGIGSFNSAENRSFVFDSTDPGRLATVAEHEAGHGFGLSHQSTPTEEYREFDGLTGAIMSAATTPRTLWWKGFSLDTGTTQDDMAVLASALGYRPDDYPNTPTSGTALSLTNGSAQVSGIISNDSDQDWFTLNWTGGAFTLDARGGVYSNKLDPRLEVRDASGVNLLASGEDPAIGQVLNVNLPAGTYRIGVMSGSHPDNGVSTHYGEAGEYTLSLTTGTSSGELPFNGTPTLIGAANPTTIQYEDYDFGGEGVAYHNTSGLGDASYRDGESVPLTYQDNRTGNIEGFASYADRSGNWTNYTVNVAQAGTYALALRAASPGSGEMFHLEVDGQNVTGALAMSATGNDSVYRTTVYSGLISLTAGQHVLRLVMDASTQASSINWFQLIPVSAGGQTPFNSSPFNVSANATSTLQAEDFDKGGQGVAYNDTTPATNTGGSYRTTEAVDIKPTTDTGGGFRISDAFAGEWLEYSINVAATGTYDVAVRAGSPSAGGAFHMELDGQMIGSQLLTPNTGAFDTMQNVTLHGVQLTAGTHLLRLAFDTVSSATGAAGGFNYIQFTPVAPPAISIAATDPNATFFAPPLPEDEGTFTITRAGPIDTDLWINFALTGTAADNSDYTEIGSAVLIPAGAASANIVVQPGGPVPTPLVARTVILTLSSNPFYTLATAQSANVTIHPVQVNNAQILGQVFNDTNGDGIQESGEAGITGRTVYIDTDNSGTLNGNELSTLTDGSGDYQFTGLAAGTYKVRQLLPAGSTQTTPAKGFGWNVTVTAGQIAGGKDFGAHQIAVNSASIAGTIFNDTNGNGIKDSGDAGIAGRTLYIDLNNNSKLDPGEQSTLTTGTSGAYQFTNLAAGTYKVRQVLPTGWTQTTPSNGFGWSVTLIANQAVSGKDFGAHQTVVATASIAGTIFNDKNGNGTKDSGESGLAGREVYIDLDNDNVLDSNEVFVKTDSSGNFKFTGLVAGTYKIRQVLPSGSKQTTPSNGFGISVSLTAGQSATGKNFGAKQ